MVYMHGEGTLTIGVSVTADGVVTPAPTDSLGLPITHTYTITASELTEPGHYHYELRDPDGNVVVSGPGNELTDVLRAWQSPWTIRRTNPVTTDPDEDELPPEPARSIIGQFTYHLAHLADMLHYIDEFQYSNNQQLR